MGINGALEFQLQFPSGIPHWSVHGMAMRFNRFQAGYLSPVYAPFLILNPDYPSINYYNPEAASKAADIWFYGWRWKLKKLDYEPSVYTELTKYAGGGIGQG